MFNCTVDGDSKDTNQGILVAINWYPYVFINNIIYDCTTGIDGVASAHVAPQFGKNNLVNSNTDNYSNWAPTSTDVTGAPKFTDETTQDYTVGDDSVAINAGYDASGSSSPGMDIGAHQRLDVVAVVAAVSVGPWHVY